MNTQQTRPLWGGSQLTEVRCVGAGRGHPPTLGPCEGPSCQRKSRGAGVSARSSPLVHIQKEGRCPDSRTSFNHKYVSTVWPQAGSECGGGYWETAQTAPSKTNSCAGSLLAPGLPPPGQRLCSPLWLASRGELFLVEEGIGGSALPLGLQKPWSGWASVPAPPPALQLL